MSEIGVESLSSPGCHNCEAFERFWDGVKSHYPNVKYTNKSILTPEGQEMAQKFGIFASPGIVINGELFSTGGVSTDKFIAKIKELSSR
ncbi:MAG TPA: thioredoxin family protein [Candidatus Paceibacterota bacterium]